MLCAAPAVQFGVIGLNHPHVDASPCWRSIDELLDDMRIDSIASRVDSRPTVLVR